MTGARLAWLFDVDGTLLLTEGAAREAFAGAVRDAFGVADDLKDIGFAGRIEPLILADILRKHRRSLTHEEEARFWDLVFGHMRRLLEPGRGRMMPVSMDFGTCCTVSTPRSPRSGTEIISRSSI